MFEMVLLLQVGALDPQRERHLVRALGIHLKLASFTNAWVVVEQSLYALKPLAETLLIKLYK